jgi:UDP-glucose 4-epimerase
MGATFIKSSHRRPRPVGGVITLGGASREFNCGYNKGYSVREVMDMVKKVAGVDFLVEEVDRREGDPPCLIVDSSRIKKELGWKPSRNDLEYIIRTALQWEEKLISR